MKGLFVGRSTADLTYIVDHYPLENEKVFSNRYLFQPGGPALNAAVTFRLLGGNATLVSGFGNEDLAILVKNFVQDQYQLSVVDLVSQENYPFPVSSILVNPSTSSRTIVNSSSGVNHLPLLSTEGIPENLDIVLLDGYNISESTIEMVKRVKKRGSTVVLDGGTWKEGMEHYLALVDIIICSNKFRFPGKTRPETIESLHQMGIQFVTFTHDEKPVEFSAGGKIVALKVPKIKAVDTLGAGDVFHGSFCYHYCDTGDVHKSLEFAIRDASNSCKYYGTHTWAKHNG
ncbi:MAG: PfkB family carbohydrate kinase [Anaerolineales bacterium]